MPHPQTNWKAVLPSGELSSDAVPRAHGFSQCSQVLAWEADDVETNRTVGVVELVRRFA